MERTYTYTARSAEDPARIVTFTLHDHRMSVGLGVPVEQIARLLPSDKEDKGIQDGEKPRLWLKPLGLVLLERRTHPFRILDVSAEMAEDRLRVRAWVRPGGLALLPITLLSGPIDNVEAAQSFVAEVEQRKAKAAGLFGFLRFLDYWLTWLGLLVFFAALFQMRRQSDRE
jgi:hypothetical protein